jgi:hypothetical protein
MRQMRKWKKQFGNRADPRQHVRYIYLVLRLGLRRQWPQNC